MKYLPGTRIDARAQWLVAVDPGTRTSGVAVFDARGVLRATDYVSAAGRGWGDVARDRAARMAVEVHRRALKLLGDLPDWQTGIDLPDWQPGLGQLSVSLAVEDQQIYRHGEGAKADPDDILAVTLVAGGVSALMADSLQCLRPKPADWKGQVPPKVMAQRIIELLGAEERPLALALKTQEDAMHAVGVGLWAFGRLR